MVQNDRCIKETGSAASAEAILKSSRFSLIQVGLISCSVVTVIVNGNNSKGITDKTPPTFLKKMGGVGDMGGVMFEG